MNLTLENMDAKAAMRVFSGVLVIILAGVFFCPSPAHGQTAPQKTPAPASSTAVPVPEIATRATEVSNLLRTLNTKLTPSSQIETIRKLLPKVSERIDRKLDEMVKILEEQPTLEALQAEQQLWQELQLRTSGWLKVLTERAVELRDALNRVSDLKQTWIKTRDAARASKAPGPVLQQVNEVLTTINARSRRWRRSALLCSIYRVKSATSWAGVARRWRRSSRLNIKPWGYLDAGQSANLEPGAVGSCTNKAARQRARSRC